MAPLFLFSVRNSVRFTHVCTSSLWSTDHQVSNGPDMSLFFSLSFSFLLSLPLTPLYSLYLSLIFTLSFFLLLTLSLSPFYSLSLSFSFFPSHSFLLSPSLCLKPDYFFFILSMPFNNSFSVAFYLLLYLSFCLSIFYLLPSLTFLFHSCRLIPSIISRVLLHSIATFIVHVFALPFRCQPNLLH